MDKLYIPNSMYQKWTNCISTGNRGCKMKLSNRDRPTDLIRHLCDPFKQKPMLWDPQSWNSVWKPLASKASAQGLMTRSSGPLSKVFFSSNTMVWSFITTPCTQKQRMLIAQGACLWQPFYGSHLMEIITSSNCFWMVVQPRCFRPFPRIRCGANPLLLPVCSHIPGWLWLHTYCNAKQIQ